MTIEPTNRQANPKKRGPGRPKKTEPKEPEVEAVLDGPARVPPLICPKCGRGMQPKVRRKRPDGVRDCVCTLCGRGFAYTPPRVRLTPESPS